MDLHVIFGMIIEVKKFHNKHFLNSILLSKKKNVSVQSAKSINDLGQLFHLPLSGIAFEQLQNLLEALENDANMQGNDTWTYIWGSHLFSLSRAYKQLIGTTLVHSSGFGSLQSNISDFFLFASERQTKHKRSIA